jgi:multidrug efflux pump subunit AcrA (membrane-fusion protein)
MKKFAFPIAIIAILAIGAFFLLQPSGTNKEQVQELFATVDEGPFVVSVTATGELQAKNSVQIRGPQGMRAAGIFETTISDLIPEGTIVKEGDYVAALDRTEIASKMSTVQTELDKIQTQLEQARIDTTIELKGLRDELINLEFTKKEKKLKLEENRYEAQSVVQATQLELERTERDFEQLKNRYKLKQIQAEAQIQEIRTLQRQNQMKMDQLSDLSDQFSINAPDGGMLVYARSWRSKKEPGSRVTAWDPVVAELPDLSDMISKTYVNEVDISKVQQGQEVQIKIDAFPDSEYSGKVLKVANIGEQLRGYDAKVFEVIVQVNEVDSIMRPAMTTSVEIVTDTYENVLFIPLEALYNDSLSFVYKKEGKRVVKQEVITGASNDTEIILDHGLSLGDEVLLTIPEKSDELEFRMIDEAIKNKILEEQKQLALQKQQEALKKRRSVQSEDLPVNERSGSSRGGRMFFTKFRVQGSGFRVLSFIMNLLTQNPELKTQNSKPRTQNPELKTQNQNHESILFQLCTSRRRRQCQQAPFCAYSPGYCFWSRSGYSHAGHWCGS